MIAVDTSIVVAAFASWHEGHASAAGILRKNPRVPAHVLIETYSVLTRLPPPHRAAADIVATFLLECVTEAPLALPPRAHLSLIEAAAAAGIAGGSIHDALIAVTAKHAHARLLSRDRRAVAVYERLGADYELIL